MLLVPVGYRSEAATVPLALDDTSSGGGFFLQLPKYGISTKPALRLREERRNKEKEGKGKREQAHTPPHSISYIKPAAADLHNIA